MPFPWWYRAWLNYHFGLAASATSGARIVPRTTEDTPTRRITARPGTRQTQLVAYCVSEIQHDLEDLSVDELISLMGGD